MCVLTGGTAYGELDGDHKFKRSSFIIPSILMILLKHTESRGKRGKNRKSVSGIS